MSGAPSWGDPGFAPPPELTCKNFFIPKLAAAIQENDEPRTAALLRFRCGGRVPGSLGGPGLFAVASSPLLGSAEQLIIVPLPRPDPAQPQQFRVHVVRARAAGGLGVRV